MTPDDPQCDPNWPQHCGGFLLTVPTEGILAVVLTWNPEVRDGYPLDFDVFDPERKLVCYSGEPFEISMSFLPK